VLTVLQPRIGAQRPQERLLKCVLRPVAAEAAIEETVDLSPMGLVERLEGRDHYS